LLKAELPQPLADSKCLTVNAEQQRAGAEVYAVGAPASQELGFSLTRGIVSGLRERHGVHHLQIDAPVSPGNSGGPLLDAKGRVLGVVVSKLAGEALEGIAFGIPIDYATRALGLSLDAKSDPALESAPAQAIASDKTKAFLDPADAVPVLKRDQGKMFKMGDSLGGANMVKRRDAQQGVDVLQTWFYVAPNLELYMVSAPTAAKDRVSIRLQQKWGTITLGECKSLELVLNGRAYPATKVNVETIKSSSREATSKIEAQYPIAVLKRVREHAPTVTIRACENRWTFASTQTHAIHKMLKEHESISGEPL
jgi:hypothetical protein